MLSLPVIAIDPDWHLQKFDLIQQRALFLQLSEEQVRRASFLDERIEAEASQGAWYPLGETFSAFADLNSTSSAQYLFHIGHCGSTFIARLLGESVGVRCLREPLTYRQLAGSRRELAYAESLLSPEQWTELLKLTLSASHRHPSNSRVYIKTSSICSNLIQPILERYADNRALGIYVPLQNFLATFLAKDQMVTDVRAFAAQRMQDLLAVTEALDWRLSSLSYPEMIGLSWVTGMHNLLSAQHIHPARLQLCNFDQLLSQPGQELQRIADFFHLPEQADTLLHNFRTTSQYHSKAPEYQYSPERRNQRIRHGMQQHAAVIQQVVSWVERLLQQHSKLAALHSHL